LSFPGEISVSEQVDVYGTTGDNKKRNMKGISIISFDAVEVTLKEYFDIKLLTFKG